jgi:prephenate dehydrogenase
MSLDQGTPIARLSIIGVGLIGGSLARAMRRTGAVGHITGVGRGRRNLERAKELGVVDDWTQDIATGVTDADMVVIAVPLGMYDQVFAAMAGHLGEQTIVSDAGSTKQHAIDMAHKYLANPALFVPAHPIAGTEQSGVEASFADLFDKRACILTPEATTDAGALQRVERMWQAAGSTTVCMDAVTHDELLAGVSHLPHIAAFALVNAVRRQDVGGHDPFAFAAGGFRDFTRIASSSPEMWRDIALSNREPLLRKIDALQKELEGLRQALQRQDGKALLDEFTAAREARERWLREHGNKL